MTDRKNTRLWEYMDSVAHSPPPPRPRGGEPAAPRSITEADLAPLRQGDAWRPTYILEQLGPASDARESLGRVVVACAVLQGVHRVYELCERLLALISNTTPRARRMVEDDNLRARRDLLKKLTRRIEDARHELTQTRARAANDLDEEALNPDGLRFVDLHVLIGHVRTAVLCDEITSRRNVTGIDYGVAVSRQAPDLAYAEKWVERGLGTAKMSRVLLFWPPQYGRVVVVYADGRLAYDPGPDSDEEG